VLLAILLEKGPKGVNILGDTHYTTKEIKKLKTEFVRVPPALLPLSGGSKLPSSATSSTSWQGVQQLMIYGTAWKKESTAACVKLALSLGYRRFDTANMSKHYNEEGVGSALMGIPRNELWIQTKYSPYQDPSHAPYDWLASLEQQVEQSFLSSLRHLKTDYLDSLLLHAPMKTAKDTLRVWRAFEGLHNQGLIRSIGVSNLYDLPFTKWLFAEAKVKPSAIQNRFYAETGYDKELRLFCLERDISYQSFWTLTANPHLLQSNAIMGCARDLGKTPEQVLFRYLTLMGVTPLTGSTSREHLIQDLECLQMVLSTQHIESITRVLQ
jgi:diketogulonate reductase-like aldo/keto reductase